ncbi:hypothetical protein L914_06620 [Phytophthora nicotianae]|uniref:Uncharacterized protein n=1 Tax=Phytophthora nicotianae TaxID=4792 RepID=W2NK48_PHYNI|nr:hypothetical protein L914_06620 [Phytophthora nicotianae]
MSTYRALGDGKYIFKAARIPCHVANAPDLIPLSLIKEFEEVQQAKSPKEGMSTGDIKLFLDFLRERRAAMCSRNTRSRVRSTTWWASANIHFILVFMWLGRLTHDDSSTASYFEYAEIIWSAKDLTAEAEERGVQDERFLRSRAGKQLRARFWNYADADLDEEDHRDEVELLEMCVQATEEEICAAPNSALLKRARMGYLWRLEVERDERNALRRLNQHNVRQTNINAVLLERLEYGNSEHEASKLSDVDGNQGKEIVTVDDAGM